MPFTVKRKSRLGERLAQSGGDLTSLFPAGAGFRFGPGGQKFTDAGNLFGRSDMGSTKKLLTTAEEINQRTRNNVARRLLEKQLRGVVKNYGLEDAFNFLRWKRMSTN